MTRNGATLRAYVPLDVRDYIESRAERESTSRSAVARRLLLDGIRARGELPLDDHEDDARG